MIDAVLSPGRYLRLDRLTSGYIWSALPIGIDPVGYLLATLLPIATWIAYVIYHDGWERLSRRPAVAVPVSIVYGTILVALAFIYLRPVRQFIYFQF
jgi:hypothetical protein